MACNGEGGAWRQGSDGCEEVVHASPGHPPVCPMENKGSVTPLLLMPHKANGPGDVLGQHWTEGVKGVTSVGESKPCLKRAGVTSAACCGSPGAPLQP